MSPERRVKSDGRYYRGIRANPDLCDGPATKYVGYFRREKRPGQSIANTRRSLRFRSRAELHSDRFTCRCNAAFGASAYCIECQKYSMLEAVWYLSEATVSITFGNSRSHEDINDEYPFVKYVIFIAHYKIYCIFILFFSSFYCYWNVI